MNARRIKLRICYIANSGYEGYFPDLISHFSKRHDVYLITYDRCVLNNVEVFRFNNHENYRSLNKIFMPWHLIQVRKLLRKIKPDLVHGYYLTSYGGIYSALSGFHPVINSTSGSDVLLDVYTTILPSQKRYFFSKILLTTVLRNSDSLIAVSPRIGRMLNNFGCPSDKIAVVPVSVDTNLFRKYSSKPQDLIESLRIDKDDKIIISTRNLAPIYGIESLIGALPIIIKKVPNAKVILLGQGSSRHKLKTMAKRFGIEKYVNFIGFVGYKEVPRYLNLADVYVSTSLSDGTARSLLEAMACQLPVVVSDIEANKEWIKHGQNGLLFQRKDPEDVANKIIYALENEHLMKKMSWKNRQLILDRAKWEKNMKEIENLYTLVCD